MEASPSELQSVLARVKEQRPDVLFSTVVGRTAQTFYRLYREAGFDATRVPIASLTMTEGEVREIGAELCEGHITAATYFGSLDRESNRRFAGDFHRAFGAEKPISMWSAGAYAQVHLFALTLESAGTLDTQRLVEAALGLSYEAPEGSVQIDPENNHTCLMPLGRARRDGAFDIVWGAKAAVKPDPYLAVTPLGARWISEATHAL
jgi:branched-chain amino acid transport system substrate-binding protein